MTLGPRVIKTGIAVTLALYICHVLSLESVMFAGVAAILTVQPSIYRTWKQVSDQVITNTLGAAIALFTLYLWGNDPITIGIVMIMVILISLKLKMENTITLTLVTVLAIMSAPGNEDWMFTLNRFSAILIGIGTGFIVNIFLFPPKYKQNYFTKVQAVFRSMSLLLRTAVSNELTEQSFKEQYNKLRKELNQLEELYKIFDEEREKLSKLNTLDVREVVVFKQMLKSVQQGEELLQIIDEHYFQSRTSDDENKQFDEHLEELIKYHEYIMLKYEGKIKLEDDLIPDLIFKSGSFLEQITNINHHDQNEKLRLVVVGSSIFEYAFQLQRLNRLVDQYVKPKKVEKV